MLNNNYVPLCDVYIFKIIMKIIRVDGFFGFYVKIKKPGFYGLNRFLSGFYGFYGFYKINKYKL